MTTLENILSGGDLRSIGNSNSVVMNIHDQAGFDELFTFLSHTNRLIAMRAADAIEKISAQHPDYLTKHVAEILSLCNMAKNKELKWHLALLIARLELKNEDLDKAWNILSTWAEDKTNSRIARVNSIQGLFEMTKHNRFLKNYLLLMFFKIKRENIPSVNSRIRKICNQMMNDKKIA